MKAAAIIITLAIFLLPLVSWFIIIMRNRKNGTFTSINPRPLITANPKKSFIVLFLYTLAFTASLSWTVDIFYGSTWSYGFIIPLGLLLLLPISSITQKKTTRTKFSPSGWLNSKDGLDAWNKSTDEKSVYAPWWYIICFALFIVYIIIWTILMIVD